MMNKGSKTMLPPIVLCREKNTKETIRKLGHASAAVAASLDNNNEYVKRKRGVPVVLQAIEIRGTTLEAGTIKALVDLIAMCTKERSKHRSQPSLSCSVAIRFFDCSAVCLDQQPMVLRALARALGNCQHVTFCQCPSLLSKSFVEGILASSHTGKLKNLRIRDALKLVQVEALAAGFESHEALRTLDLSNSNFESRTDFLLLAKALREGASNLKCLSLREMNLTDVDLEVMLGDSSSASNPSCPMPELRTLDISSNRLRNLANLGRFLSHPDCRMQKLSIGYQIHYGDRDRIDVSSIAQALHTNKSLTTLELQRNKLGDSDAILLAHGLAKNCTLEILDLENNNFTDTGIVELAKSASSGGVRLKRLEVRHNDFGLEGMLALSKAASENWSMLRLSGLGRSYWHHRNHNPAYELLADRIRYHTALNRCGRRILKGKIVPEALWALVMGDSHLRHPSMLGSTYQHLHSDVVFNLLKEIPEAFFA